MKKLKKVGVVFLLVILAMTLLSVNCFALSESEVKAQINQQGKENVTGNVFIWFLCAIAFLKVSQKIDSFMASLGINVGHTGGNMLAEAVIAARGISMARGFAGGAVGKGGSSGGGGSGGGSSPGFLSGGLAGVVGRQFSSSAMNVATGQSNNIISKKMFNSSLSKGGSFANNIVSAVATGSSRSTGSITGATAADSLVSYMGLTGASDIPKFSNVEIGGGRIMGSEVTAANPNGIQFGMYNTGQYMEPSGDYSTVKAVDGTQWYKQYATDTVERSPYMTADGKVAYHENIVQKLPPIPRRKDKV